MEDKCVLPPGKVTQGEKRLEEGDKGRRGGLEGACSWRRGGQGGILHFVSEVRGRAQGWSKVHVSGGQSEKPDDPSKLVCAVDGE